MFDWVQMAYFIKRTFRKRETLDKADPMSKFATLVKNTFMTT